MAVIGREGLKRCGNHVVPALFGGQRVEVGQRAFGGPIPDREAEHLNGSRCIACGDAGAQNGHGVRATAPCDGHVLPADAASGQRVAQRAHGGSFATGCPPVQHLDLLGCDRRGRQRQNGGAHVQFLHHGHVTVPPFLTPPLRAWVN